MKKQIVIIVGGAGGAAVTTVSDIINDHIKGLDATTIVVDEFKDTKELLKNFRKSFDSEEFKTTVFNEPPLIQDLITPPELYNNRFKKKPRGNKYGHSKFF
jgi:hypothetical protein